MHSQKSFSNFVCGPENRLAVAAFKNLAAELGNLRPNEVIETPFIYLHGPAGTGKSHLVGALVQEIITRKPSLTVNIWETSALVSESAPELLDGARECDLVVLEDLQQLSPPLVETVIQLLDGRLCRGQVTVVTAGTGPRKLLYRGERFSGRLTSRLAAGLVIALNPLQPGRRRLLLEDLARQRRLVLSKDVLTWLAEHLTGGGRQLLGAINQLVLLTQLQHEPLDLAGVSAHLREEVEARRPTVEGIAQRVSGYFRVPARQLQSQRRYRNILVPRHVGMYLARRLTGLSLEQIGAYFGGRDHTTVLHACRKVEAAMGEDAALCGAVQQLQAELV
jgi:chromosomal replication initiator protein